MDTDLLTDILNCPSLPSLPAVAAKVLELTSDPDVKMTELASQITDIHKALGEFASREKSERTQLEQALGAIGSQVKKLADRDNEESRPRRRRTGRTYPAVTPQAEMREDVAREEKASRVDKAAENDLEATLERLRSLHSGE